MQYKLGQHVLCRGRKGTIVQIHDLFDQFLYTIKPDLERADIFTISEDEIELC